MTYPSERRRRLLVSSELFLQMFCAGPHRGYTVIDQAIPEDAQLVRVSLSNGVIEFLLDSASFEGAKPGEIVEFEPQIRPTLRSDQ